MGSLATIAFIYNKCHKKYIFLSWKIGSIGNDQCRNADKETAQSSSQRNKIYRQNLGEWRNKSYLNVNKHQSSDDFVELGNEWQHQEKALEYMQKDIKHDLYETLYTTSNKQTNAIPEKWRESLCKLK